MTQSLISALGYIGLNTKQLDAWRGFAAQMLGMHVEECGDAQLLLRLDEKAQRYLIRQADKSGLGWLGFEVAGAAQLESLTQLLSAQGRLVIPASEEELRTRDVAQMIWALDPDGHRVEFYHCLGEAPSAFAPSRPVGGFRTGELGLGHIVLYTPHYEEMSAFYQTLLGFRLTDYHHEPFAIEFLRVNQRHHSLALIADAGAPRIHHVMAEYRYWDDVGRAYDLALAEPQRIAVSLGRHLNDHVTSFYLWTPDDFFIELGWAGRSVDDATWEPQEVAAPSLWGHIRYWQTEAKREQTRKLISAVGARGERAPVAVTGEGPFSLPPRSRN